MGITSRYMALSVIRLGKNIKAVTIDGDEKRIKD